MKLIAFKIRSKIKAKWDQNGKVPGTFKGLAPSGGVIFFCQRSAFISNWCAYGEYTAVKVGSKVEIICYEMKLNYIIRFIMFVVLGAALNSCAPKKSEDCGFVQNVYGQRISWKRNSSPIQIYVSHSVPAELKPAIYRATASWELTLGRKIFEVIEENSSQTSTPSRDKKNGIYFLSQWESDRKSEQGRTSVYWAGDEIQEADIRINSADFSYYDQNPQQLVKAAGGKTSAGYNFEALILHELGHFMGLKHRETGGTVMAKELGAYSDRTKLATVDVESVQCEYK